MKKGHCFYVNKLFVLKLLLLASQINYLGKKIDVENLLCKNNAGRGKRAPEEQRKNKNHPSMMVSRSKVSGMVNFLSTVNIGKLSGKD